MLISNFALKIIEILILDDNLWRVNSKQIESIKPSLFRHYTIDIAYLVLVICVKPQNMFSFVHMKS